MKKLSLLLAFVGLSILAMGCNQKTVTNPVSPDKKTADGHDHASADHKAPHGGHLVELGRNHEYHAELVDNHETGSITVYIMDGDLKPLAIKQPSVTLILTAGENTQTFELLGSQSGEASEFASDDEKMMGMIDTKGVTGKIRATIDGKPFSGTFDHEAHGHEGHDHGHEGEDHAGHKH